MMGSALINSNSYPIIDREHCVIKNKEGWQLSTDRLHENSSFQLIDPWGLIPKDPVYIILNQVTTNDPSAIANLLSRKIHHLHSQNNRFGFQVYKQNGQLYVDMDRYGLQGGGHLSNILIGTIGCLAGAAMLLLKKNLEGRLRLGSFMPATIYAIKSYKEYPLQSDIENDDAVFKRKLLIGTAITGASIATEKIFDVLLDLFDKNHHKKLIFKLLKSTLSGLVSYATLRSLEHREMTKKEIFLTCLTRGSTVLVEAACHHVLQEQVSRVVKVVTKNVLPQIFSSMQMSKITQKDRYYEAGYFVENDPIVGTVNGIVLFTLGLIALNRGERLQASFLLGSSIPPLLYTATTEEYRYKESIFYETLLNACTKSATLELIKYVAPNPDNFPLAAMALAKKIIKPEILSLLQNQLKNCARLEVFVTNIAHQTFSSSISIILQAFEGTLSFSLKKMARSGKIIVIGAFAQSILNSRFEIEPCRNIDVFWENRNIPEVLNDLSRRARIRLALQIIPSQMINTVTSVMVENNIKGKEWGDGLLESLFLTSLIAAADGQGAINEFRKKLEPQLQKVYQARQTWNEAENKTNQLRKVWPWTEQARLNFLRAREEQEQQKKLYTKLANISIAVLIKDYLAPYLFLHYRPN